MENSLLPLGRIGGRRLRGRAFLGTICGDEAQRFRVGGDFFFVGGGGSGVEEFDWPQQKKGNKNRLIKSNKTFGCT